MTIVDDYGHHPTEIAATLDALRQGYPGRRIVLAFQPHRYTRTRDLIDDFANVLSTADTLLVTEVYAAGEAPIPGADGRAICRAVRSRGKVEPVFVEKVEDLHAALRDVLKPGDVMLTWRRHHQRRVARASREAQRHPRPGGRRDVPAAWRINFEEARVMAPSLRIDPRFAPRVKRDEPMSRHTSWHVGGPADVFFTPRDRDRSHRLPARCCRADVPLLWLGLGSNLLVRDGGIRGVVIDTTRRSTSSRASTRPALYAEAGVPCARIARHCISLELGPAEFFAGIPGTLGGALAMNAGAFGGETWPHVRAVDVCDRARPRAPPRGARVFVFAIGTSCRRCPTSGFSAPCCSSSLGPASPTRRCATCSRAARRRQPIGEWSCGSMFTNPPGDHAARLIEAAGLKGTRIGDAMVSPKHANFIVNRGGHGRRHRALVQLIQQEVKRKFAVQLTPEFRIVGETPDAPASQHQYAGTSPTRTNSGASRCCSAALPPSARSRCCRATPCLAALLSAASMRMPSIRATSRSTNW